MKRLKVLVSAYACEPGKGSEPGIGWHTAKALAAHHDIWVLTRANNRPAIEAELGRDPVPNLHFAYYDLPNWASWWKKGGRGVRLYYYLWQVAAYFVARDLHRKIDFDLTHHVTFGMYWTPSFVALLPPPFVWGPVGGGESAPKAFWSDFSSRGQRYERLREINQWVATKDPFIRATAARSVKALTTTEETLEKLKALPLRDASVQGNCALSESDLSLLGKLAKEPSAASANRVVFVSIGRLLHWKGYHLALRAFAAARLESTEYWIIGDGPERSELESLALELGIANKVSFLGKLPREKTLQKLAASDALLHPSLHDSGGWVTLEAMAARKPVVCLDLGGPATQVTQQTGIKIAAHSPEQVVRDLAEALRCLAGDGARLEAMGQAGRARVEEVYSWTYKGRKLNEVYQQISERIRGGEEL